MISLGRLSRLNITAWLGRRSRLFLVAATILLFAAAAVLRMLLPPAIHIAVLFLIPVSFAAWFLSPAVGWIGVVAATAILLAFDIRHYANGSAVLFWNALLNFGMFAFSVFIISDVRALYHREQALSLRDSLTGLLNRRAFNSVVGLENRRLHRVEQPLTLAYIDLDGFKAVNDEHGHDVGDLLLRALGDTMRAAVRSTDFVARLGGDEFAILLPATDAESARAVMTKVQQTLTRRAVELHHSVTFSIGAVTFERSTGSAAEMIRAADQAMYAAKQSGKNKIEFRKK